MVKNKGYSMLVNKASRSMKINMYGEVVSERPIDWRTGKPIKDKMIVLSEFLDDLESLKDYDEITIHINSVGGEAYAGLAIYNRLKGLNKNITTINDSTAHSAGSVIFMSGNTRKVRAASSTMIHCCASFMWGYYDAEKLKKVVNQFETINENIADIYARNTTMSKEQALEYMRDETWMTGEKAVELGFAHEVIEDGEDLGVTMALDRSYMISRGQKICAMFMPKELPEGIDIIEPEQETETEETPEKTIIDNSEETKGEETMNIENLEALVKEYPDLCKELTEKARNEERERIKSISAIAANVSDREFVENALYGEERISAKDFAYNAMMAGKVASAPTVNKSVLDAMEKQAEESGANAVGQASITQQSDAVKDDAENMDVAKVGAYMKNLAKKGGVE